MATLISDVYTDSSRFHDMVTGSARQHQHAHSARAQSHDPHGGRNRTASRSRDRDTTPSEPSGTNTTTTATALTPLYPTAATPAATTSTTPHNADQPEEITSRQRSSTSGASRFPSPPSSTSSEASSSAAARPQHGTGTAFMSSSSGDRSGLASSAASAVSSTSTAATVIPLSHAPSHQIPSPASEPGSRWNNSLTDLAGQSSTMAGPRPDSPAQVQTTIHIRDLAHVQSLARGDMLTKSASGILNDPPLQAMKYEISGMPINDIIEMVAALLTKITTTNDLQHDALSRNAAHIRQAQAAASRSEEGGSASSNDHMSPLSSSVLAFHGKNVPAITILSYLSRIHKYCPTTYEVFLSLLVYFDRMTERVNDIVIKAGEARRQQQTRPEQDIIPQPTITASRPGTAAADQDTVMRDDSDEGDEVDSDLADDDDDDDDADGTDDDEPGSRTREPSAGAVTGASAPTPGPVPSMVAPIPQATYFVVDSFNIHRLIIAGVACASKFFSDVFYTNSRYAKVGGLPLAELNHLELQFLLLNDFRLAVPVEDLEAYATMLVEFYAREVVTHRSRPVVGME